MPTYQDLMLPLLRAVGDANSHRVRDVVEELADQFRLSADERAELLPSGTQKAFVNRVNWGATYLRKAGLLESPARAHVRLTEEGTRVLAMAPAKVDRSFLMRYPAFVAFVSGVGRPEDESSARERVPAVSQQSTPDERMQDAAAELRVALKEDLLAKVKAASPGFFERLVIDVLLGMGYGGSRREAAEHLGRSGDGGLDGVIKQDPLGLDAVYVQAKR